MSDAPMYGWYSEEMHQTTGSSSWYDTPFGGKVLITTVSSSCEDSGTKWPDVHCVGRVTKWFKKGPQPPPHPDPDEEAKLALEREWRRITVKEIEQQLWRRLQKWEQKVYRHG